MLQLLYVEDVTPESKRFLDTLQQLPLQLGISQVPGPRRAWFFIQARIYIDAIVASSTLTDVDLLELISFERDHNPRAQLILFGPVPDADRVERLGAAAFLSFDQQPDELADELQSVLNKEYQPSNTPNPDYPYPSKRWDPATSVVLHIQCIPTDEQITQIKEILDEFTWQNHRELRYRAQRYSLQLHKEDGLYSEEELLAIASQLQSKLARIGMSPCFLLFSQTNFNRQQCYNSYSLMDYAMDFLITCDMRVAFMTTELLSQIASTVDVDFQSDELLQAIRTRQKNKALQLSYQIHQKLQNLPMVNLQRLRILINDCMLSISNLTNQRYASEIFDDLAAVCRLDRWQSMFVYLQKWLERFSTMPQAENQETQKTFMISQILNAIDNIPLASLSVESIARTVYRSPTYLNDVFKEEMGISLVKYIGHHRLTMAAELIRGSNRKIIDIAKETGYDNYSYFCQIFRKEFSVSPAKYRTIDMEPHDFSAKADQASMSPQT